MSRGRGRNKNHQKDDDGFGKWGGYMAAKRAKLLDQFHDAHVEKVSDIFNGVAIMVNGLTHPSANVLKDLMAAHGGVFHMYQVSSTTHIIASNLPNIKHLGSVPIVKPSWITESIALGKQLDYRRYLLYTNQSTTQPALNFPVIQKTSLNNTPAKNLNETTNESNSDTNSVNAFEETSILEVPHSMENKTIEATSVQTITSSVDPKNIRSILEQTRVTKTASDPNFLEEFYNNSRLHLISTLGAEFKQLVGQLREKSDGKFPGKEKLIITKGRATDNIIATNVIMHIDMDCFFVSVGLKNHPELKGKPVAITHARSGQIKANPDRKVNREKEFELYYDRLTEGGSAKVVDIKTKIDAIDANASMSEIASCSYEARKFGIKNGMFLGSAIKLCPELKTLPYDFEGYKEVSNMLYKTVASYTLDIEAVSCDEMYVDITTLLRDTGLTVLEWADHIRNEIMTVTGCPCSTGFGANRLQARLATRKAKPAGQYYLQADDVEMYMLDIPLGDLPGVGRATLTKLKNLGLNTCGDVQMAPLKLLQSKLGMKAGETLKDQARGVDNKPLNFHHERKSVSAEVNYGIRFKTLDECYVFLQSLSNEVFNRLSDIGMRARCLTLKLLVRATEAPVETAKFLGHGVCDALSKSTTSNLIINDSKTIFREAKMLYDKLNIPYAELRGLGIQLTKLEKNDLVNKAMSNFLKQGAVVKATKLQSDHTVTAKPVQDSMNVKNKETENTSQKNVTKLTVVPQSNKKVALEQSSISKSKRGRPKGSTNRSKLFRTVAHIDKKNPVNNMTLRKKDNASQPVQQQNLNRHTIDLDVLNALPEELRNEVIKEYQLDTNIVLSSNKAVEEPNRTEKTKGIKESSLSDKDKTETKQKGKRSPFDGLSWDQIKPIIKRWVQSENVPSAVDVQMLANHFKELAINRNIEVLKCVFNFLHRTFSTMDCNWHKAYYSLVNTMQEGMVARYGNTLMVNRTFNCCQM